MPRLARTPPQFQRSRELSLVLKPGMEVVALGMGLPSQPSLVV